MKRLLLALTILVAGATAFCAFRSSAARSQSEASQRQNSLAAQTETLLRTRAEHTELTARIAELKKRATAEFERDSTQSALANLVTASGSNHLSPEAREELLARLGFNWSSLPDYVVVSKETLPKLGLTSIRDYRLTDTVCSVLAVTPEERAKIDSLLADAATQFKTWAMAHVERAEPSGDILAKYTMPFDEQFSQSISNTVVPGVMAALGSQRGEFMLGYGTSWFMDLGLQGSGPITLTIKRPPGGREGLDLELRTRENGVINTGVTPWQPMPEAFRAIFPGGWPDLATRENFELPKAFTQKQ